MPCLLLNAMSQLSPLARQAFYPLPPPPPQLKGHDKLEGGGK